MRQLTHDQGFVLLGRVSATIAHEIRNPLHNIHLILGELGQPERVVENAELSQRLQANLKRLDGAVDLIYRIGKPPSIASPTGSTADLVATVHESIRFHHLQEGTSAVWNAAVPATAMVACSEHNLRIIIDNLLRNALAAMEVVIEPITLVCQPSETGWELIIENAGSLPAQLTREGKYETPSPGVRVKGLGIGVAVARQLASDAGGNLDLSSTAIRVTAVLNLPASPANIKEAGA